MKVLRPERVMERKSLPKSFRTKIGICHPSVHRVVKRDLKTAMFQKAKSTKRATKFAHLFHAKQLLRKYSEHTKKFSFSKSYFTPQLLPNLLKIISNHDRGSLL